MILATLVSYIVFCLIWYKRIRFRLLKPVFRIHLVTKEDPSLPLIDVRTPDEDEKLSLPGAMNIPLADLLCEDWQAYLNQDVIKINIFYSNGTLKSDKAWMITRLPGYENNSVLMDGLNDWAETILNPSAPDPANPDDEFARYDFRKGAGMVLGGC